VAYSLVQLTVQCCIQTVCCGIQFGSADCIMLYTNLCCGFQFALQVVTFNLLLQCVCHSVDCQLHCQFVSANSTMLYIEYVVWFQLALQFVTFNCCYSMSVIQLTESCIVINFADIYG